MPAFTGSADFQEDAHGNTIEEGEAEACTEVHRRAVRSHSRGLPVENVVQGLSAELGEEIPSLRREGTRAEEEKEDHRSRQDTYIYLQSPEYPGPITSEKETNGELSSPLDSTLTTLACSRQKEKR